MATHKEKIEIEVDVPDGMRLNGQHEQRWNCCDFERVTAIDVLLKVEPIPKPYVFPSFLPEGWWLYRQCHGMWSVCSSEPRKTPNGLVPYGNYVACDVSSMLIWTPPTDAQYAGKPMKVTH